MARSISQSAARCWTAWKLPIGRPNCSRTFACSSASSCARPAAPSARATRPRRSSATASSTSASESSSSSTVSPRRTADQEGIASPGVSSTASISRSRAVPPPCGTSRRWLRTGPASTRATVSSSLSVAIAVRPASRPSRRPATNESMTGSGQATRPSSDAAASATGSRSSAQSSNHPWASAIPCTVASEPSCALRAEGQQRASSPRIASCISRSSPVVTGGSILGHGRSTSRGRRID